MTQQYQYRYTSAAEHPAYTYIDRYWPIQVEFDESQPTKLLVKDQYASIFDTLYTVYKQASDIYTVLDWADLLDTLNLPDISAVGIEFANVAVIVLKVLIAAVQWAVERDIEISQFDLFTGGMGGCRIGWTPMGGVLYREC